MVSTTPPAPDDPPSLTAESYDFWLCDLDGTLIDIDPEYARDVMHRVGDRLGVSFTDDETDVLWYGIGGSRDVVLRERDIDPERFWDVFHEEENPRERAAATYLYDDAAVVADLDGPVGIVTHCQPYLTEPILDELGIREWFDAVVCCTDEIGWKPDPRPVERLMRDLGVAGNGARGALLGDDPHDTGAAWNAGLDAIHVERHEEAARGRCVLGDHRIDGLDTFRG